MLKHISKNFANFIKINNYIRNMASSIVNSYETLNVNQVKEFVYQVELNRPDKLNAFNTQMVSDLGNCFNELNENPDCRAIVLSASGKHFTAGLDLRDMMEIAQKMVEIEEVGRIGQLLGKKIRAFQQSISSLETCCKPVIVTIHSACIGAGVDLISTADIRYCTQDTFFQIKEVDIGMAADVGTLQRFPKAIGSQSLARELCFTGRKFDSKEAFLCGFVTKIFEDRNKMIEEAIDTAELIATKSPIAVQATKKNIIYSLEHTNQEGLDHIYEMNKLLLQSKDFIEACMAQATKSDPPVFAKL